MLFSVSKIAVVPHDIGEDLRRFWPVRAELELRIENGELGVEIATVAALLRNDRGGGGFGIDD